MKNLKRSVIPLLLVLGFFSSYSTAFAVSLVYHQPIFRLWEATDEQLTALDIGFYQGSGVWAFAWKADGGGFFDHFCTYLASDLEGVDVEDMTIEVLSRGQSWPGGPSSEWFNSGYTTEGTSEELTITDLPQVATSTPYTSSGQNGYERYCFQFNSAIHYDDEEALMFKYSWDTAGGGVYVLNGDGFFPPNEMVHARIDTTSWVGFAIPFQLWVGDPLDFVPHDGNFNTHVIRINEPLEKTTTISNNVVFEFDYYTKYLLDDSHADAYGIILRRPLTGEYVRLDNWETYEDPDLIVGSAPAINIFDFGFNHTEEDAYTRAGAFYAETGSYELSILLYNREGDCEASCNYLPLGEAKTIYFSVVENEQADNPLFNPDYGGTYGTYDNAMCDLNLNPFEESTFSVSGCAGYLFIPQENAFSQYAAVRTDLAGKKPFSYMAGIQTEWNTLTASGTATSSQTQFALHDLGIGSSTAIGNFLPNATVFSSTTVRHYLPDPIFNALLALAVAALWLTFFGVIFFETKYLLQKL